MWSRSEATQSDSLLLWLDTEFLDATRDLTKQPLLECAVMITSAVDIKRLFFKWSTALRVSADELASAEASGLLSREIKAQHSASGLWHDVQSSTVTPACLDDVVVDALVRAQRRICHFDGNVYAAGASVYVDMQLVKRWLPKTAACLSHQLFDCTVIWLMFKSSWLPYLRLPPRTSQQHRALLDITDTHRMACAFFDQMGAAGGISSSSASAAVWKPMAPSSSTRLPLFSAADFPALSSTRGIPVDEKKRLSATSGASGAAGAAGAAGAEPPPAARVPGPQLEPNGHARDRTESLATCTVRDGHVQRDCL